MLPFQPLLHVSIILAMAAGFVLASKMPQFVLDQIVIEGCDVDLAKELRGRVNLAPDAGTLTVNLAHIRRDIETDPRVARASVTRCLPHCVRIEVFPREAKAAVRHGQEYVLVDAEGICLARVAAPAEGLDELRGIEVGDGRPGTRVSGDVLGVAFHCIALTDCYDPDTAWTFDFSDPLNIVMQGPDTKAFLGTAENLKRKMAIVFAAPDAAREKGIAIDIVDVRRADAPVLRRK